VPRTKREAIPNIALYNLRDSLAETQEQVAEALNRLAEKRGEATAITGNHVSRWERGIVHPSPLHKQLLAEHYNVTVAELGLTRQRIVPAGHGALVTGSPADLLAITGEAEPVEASVAQSQQEWLHIRRRLNAHHLALAQTAALLYPEAVRVGSTGLIAPPGWIRSPLLNLSDIELTFERGAGRPSIDGTEEFTRHVRPLRAPGRRFQRYSHAIRDVARPRLFENRYSWRLLGADFSDTGARLRFGDMNYFDAMDTCEAVAHETAAAHLVNDGQVAPASWRGLHFRKAIGDPFDLARRSLLVSINTLTIRFDGTTATVVLHDRSAANVATSGGVIGVMPAGVFQPSTVRPGNHSADFDLWRNIMREYSEEFLGNEEHTGDDESADYSSEPFRSLDSARREGKIRVYCLGIALGGLDLWGGIETVAVFDADTFDDVFSGLVRVNDEGTVVQVGRAQPTSLVPFNEHTIAELSATGRLAPETLFSLRTAWDHRDQLLFGDPASR
jgi:transcriptional regulator with XRE-family HTH domain